MALSAFDDAGRPPETEALAEVLGASHALWQRLVAQVSDAHAPITPLWEFSGAKYGWSLRLKRRGRIVLYMTPQAGSFLLGIVLGEKAASAARAASVPERLLALIDGAPRYGEGRGIRMTVVSTEDVDAAVMLAALKMAR